MAGYAYNICTTITPKYLAGRFQTPPLKVQGSTKKARQKPQDPRGRW